ncbi:MAG: hypothetical protein K6F27_08445 [Ruminococcus sp.]|nr:hypothetical protein [Ruminococcus sp.]
MNNISLYEKADRYETISKIIAAGGGLLTVLLVALFGAEYLILGWLSKTSAAILSFTTLGLYIIAAIVALVFIIKSVKYYEKYDEEKI